MPAQYAYASDFDTATGNMPAPDEARVNALLEMASRLYDRASGVAPGHWAPITSTTYRFRATGGSRLYLRDATGAQYLLRTITADSLAIDSDADGVFDDYLLDLNDAWLQPIPENAVAHGEAYTSLELLPLSTATITTWPDARDCVRITGTWGYAAVPTAVKQRVIDIAHGLSQRQHAGGYGTDESLQQGELPAWVMRLVDSHYSHRIPAF